MPNECISRFHKSQYKRIFYGPRFANLNRNVIRKVNQQQARKVLTLGKRMVLVCRFAIVFPRVISTTKWNGSHCLIINCPLEVVLVLFGAVANAASATA